VAVHPTQLYEAIGLGLLGWVLIQWRRRGVSNATVLGRYVVTAGVLRFGIEFLRVNERVAFGLSVAHFISLSAIAMGSIVLLDAHQARRTISAGSQRS
jgi:phosphatidylglycerol:prolipoprotein diacylglycerol transferase